MFLLKTNAFKVTPLPDRAAYTALPVRIRESIAGAARFDHFTEIAFFTTPGLSGGVFDSVTNYVPGFSSTVVSPITLQSAVDRYLAQFGERGDALFGVFAVTPEVRAWASGQDYRREHNPLS